MNFTSKSSPARGTAATGRPRGVLAVDDEPMIRQFLALMLPSAGCQVFMAENGYQALEIAGGERGPEIDLLITDLWMPGMTGTELATELRAIRPAVKTLIISGDLHSNIATATQGLPESAWLPKPFQFNALCNAIRALFEAKPAHRLPTAMPAACV